MRGRVFTAACLVNITGLIVCRGAGLAGGLTLCALVMGTIINYTDNFLGDGFVGVREFSLLSGVDICVLGGRLIHEVL